MADLWTERRRSIEDAAIGFGIVGALGFVFRYLIGSSDLGNAGKGGPAAPGVSGDGRGPTPIARVRPLSGPVDLTPLHPATLIPGGYDLPPGTILPPGAGRLASGPTGSVAGNPSGSSLSAAPSVVGLSGVSPLARSASGLELSRGGAAGPGLPCAVTYQTRPGDTLRAIARRFYGDNPEAGQYYGAIIYEVNADAIEAAARAHGFQSSGRGNRLATSLWLCLPALHELHLPVPG